MPGKSLCLVVSLLVALVVVAAPASADTIPPGARSTSSAILGAEGFMCGALPPPGFYMIDYVLYYHAHELKGQDGGEVEGAPFTDFKTTAWADVIRPVYVSPWTLFGGNMAWHAVIPIVHKNQKSDYFDDSMDGIGDIYISPLILSWHMPPFHWAAGLDVIAPTGRYNEDNITNIGNNHWTFEPAFAVSYMGDNGIMGDLKLMYDFHTKDHELDYTEGQQFHLDYNAGLALGADKALKVGVAGYWLLGVQDDKGPSGRIDDSKEGVFAIGPSIMYCKGNLSLEAKVLFEMDAQNRPEGTATWLKLVYSF